MERKKRGRYKRYLASGSSTPVPKRTVNYWKLKEIKSSMSHSDS